MIENKAKRGDHSFAELELWAGVECTVNRVGDQYFNQIERSGHFERLSDLEKFAELGISAIRYPVLWELTAPESVETADWSWADERLSFLRQLNIRPIVGLVHHGSGPYHTNLLDPQFPEKLAAYARAVAMRYPWIEDFTPINEPLTTARFSGLYGYWYPHGRDNLTFARALLNQCRAIVLAMRAIREINPTARLVQTEDLGKIHSTDNLQYQAKFENNRRWLSFDLLCGRVNEKHPLWSYFRSIGIIEAELKWFLENRCPPDIFGLNYYVTSERYLDERLKIFPPCSHGGNGRHRYADVEAVRAVGDGIAGAEVIIREAWERYKKPLAITEAHIGCTREEQMRWFKEIWDAAECSRAKGVDIRAVTAWALLGAFDWNTLVTCSSGCYEPGVFDLRSNAPRPTALSKMLHELAINRKYNHPVLDSPGWWRRPERLLFQADNEKSPNKTTRSKTFAIKKAARPILITGGTGTLGSAFARICEKRGLEYGLLSRKDLDIANPVSIVHVFNELKPWAVINAAGYVRVDDAEREADLCFRENTTGASLLAEHCAERKIALLTFSSDLVFDGKSTSPYVESDGVAPLNVYGQSKAEAERRVLTALPSALVIRTSAFFGPWDKYNFIYFVVSNLSAGKPFSAANDLIVSPTYVPDLVNSSLDLLIDEESGLWHLTNEGAITWAELARRAAKLAGLDANLIDSRPAKSLGFIAPRPKYSALGSKRSVLLPSLESSISRYFQERQQF